MSPSLREQIIYLCCIVSAVLVGYFAPQNVICALIATGLSYVGVFFHELGHTLFYWLYGYIAVPTFDFASGGGMTYQFGERSWLLQVAVWLCLCGLAAVCWQRVRVLVAPVGIFTTFVIVTSLMGLHQDVIIFMGHGVEAALAAFLLCRGYYNIWLSRPAERWVNVFIGAYLMGSVVTLVWALMFNPYFAAEYEMQKGSHRMGDFDRLVDDAGVSMLHIGWLFIAYAVACIAVLKMWISHHVNSKA